MVGSTWVGMWAVESTRKPPESYLRDSGGPGPNWVITLASINKAHKSILWEKVHGLAAGLWLLLKRMGLASVQALVVELVN